MSNNLGVALANQGRIVDAVERYSVAAKLDPRPGYVCDNLEACLDRYLNTGAILGLLFDMVIILVLAGIVVALAYSSVSSFEQTPCPVRGLCGDRLWGDPACDVMAAWTYLSADTRAAFRAAVSVDDATWARSRGIARHAIEGAFSDSGSN